MDGKLLTIDELANQLSVKTSWLYQNHRNLGLPAIKLGNQLRFDPEDVRTFLEAAKSGNVRSRTSVSVTDANSKAKKIQRVVSINQQPSTEQG